MGEGVGPAPPIGGAPGSPGGLPIPGGIPGIPGGIPGIGMFTLVFPLVKGSREGESGPLAQLALGLAAFPMTTCHFQPPIERFGPSNDGNSAISE